MTAQVQNQGTENVSYITVVELITYLYISPGENPALFKCHDTETLNQKEKLYKPHLVTTLNKPKFMQKFTCIQ